MTAAYVTLGCKVSQYETQAIRTLMEKRGYKTVPFTEKADVYIINSCTVTATGDKKSRQMTHRARRLNENGVVVLCGCFPQANVNAAREEKAADIICGTVERARIPDLVEEFLEKKERIIAVKENIRNEEYENISVESLDEHTRAYVKIEDGCDRFCTYCLVPFARGNIRSRPLEEIKKEAKRLSEKGYLEIVLAGINLSAYGQSRGLDLSDAVKAAAEGDMYRVRLGSLEPDLLTDEMIEKLSGIKNLCRQFHISLQSGSDGVLRRMNRHYLTSDYEKLVRTLREKMPDCAITTDIMVGFPGETEEEFEETLDFVRRIGFSSAHIFIYSSRIGTVAAKMPDQIPSDIGKSRSKRLFAEIEKTRKAYLRSRIGQLQEALCLELEEGETKCILRDGTEVKVKGEYTGLKNIKILSENGDAEVVK